MLRKALKRYEKFLTLDADDSTGERLRARAVLAFGGTFILIQLLNLLNLTLTTGGFSPEHGVAIGAASTVFLALLALRWIRTFAVYAIFIGLICNAAPLTTALYDYTGIHSSLLPFIILGPMMNGFVCGPRAAFVTGILGLVAVAILTWNSAISPVAEAAFFDERTTARAVQASFAIIMVTVVSVVSSANTFDAFTFLSRDRERAIAGEKAKATFIAKMSHEWRTPLNAVLGTAALLERSGVNEEQEALLQQLRASAQKMAVQVDEVIDLSDIESGVMELTEEVFSPRRLLIALCEPWQTMAEAKGLSFRIVITDQVPAHVKGDEKRLRQSLAHIISNAVTYTAKGGVLITLDHEADKGLVTTVSDSGPGIPEEDRQRLFEPFTQADDSDTRRNGGAGLGLAIARGLLSHMNGALILQRSTEKGSVFRAEAPFPATEKVVPQANQSRFATRQPAFSEMRFLVVDDNEINRKIAVTLLKMMGIKADTAAHGEEALDALRINDYSAVLLDLHMPVLGGLAVVEQMRSDPVLAEIPVIAFTADAQLERQAGFVKAGFDAHLLKPVSFDAMKAVVADVFRPKADEKSASA